MATEQIEAEDLERLIAHEATYFEIWSRVMREEGVWFFDALELPSYQSASRAIRLRDETGTPSFREIEGRVAQIIAHYRGLGLPVVVDVDPIAERQGFGPVLRRRGVTPVIGKTLLMRYRQKPLGSVEDTVTGLNGNGSGNGSDKIHESAIPSPMAIGAFDPCPSLPFTIHRLPNETGAGEAAEWIALAGAEEEGFQTEGSTEESKEEAAFWRAVAAPEARSPRCRLYLARMRTKEDKEDKEDKEEQSETEGNRTGGRAVGTCQLFSAQGWAQIDSVMTHPDFRRLGIASALVTQALRDSLALGNTTTYLYTDHGGPGEQVYRKLGFEVWGVDVLHRHILW